MIAEKSSSYIMGAVSPIGQKKVLPTLNDNTALKFNSIFVSGGRRGLELEIEPKLMSELLKAQFSPIIVV